jgi:tRNA dimethylallyltransferase
LNKILTIIGPTASGKTSLSIEIAKLVNGEIIGLDSRQIYKFMKIGTAQPSSDDLERVPHHLIGVRDPKYTISAGQYTEMVKNKILEINSRNKIPIICGGSGLYFRSLYFGLFNKSKSDKNIRKKLEKAYDKHPEALLKRLKKVDLEYSKIVHINNKKRLVRALEIFEITGESPSHHFKNQKKDNLGSKMFTIYLLRDRNKLLSRISARTKKMLQEGWIDEVRNLLLLQRKSGFTYSALNSIGYNQIIDYLNGLLDYKSLEIKIIQKTNQLSKKQNQWFKKENIDLIIDMDRLEVEEVANIICNLVYR